MIVIQERKIAIMTPPKCGTHALHAGLSAPPFRCLTYCGPSRTETPDQLKYDWHSYIWPNETGCCKKLIVVRCPYQRLVSLYAHHCSDCSGRGHSAPSFQGFMTGVMEKAYAPFYWQTLTQLFEGVHYDGILRHESLVEDLNREGLEVDRLPKLFCSNLRKPHYAFYDASTFHLANQWALPDCEAFGYSAPVQFTASLGEMQ
jgi:hypothetical protein